MFIDTHCHISKEYYVNFDEVINSAIKNQINKMISSGSNGETNVEVIDTINKYNEIYGTIGIHPHDASVAVEKDYNFIEDNLTHNKIVAIGEIGLDYYYGKEHKEIQKKCFERQLKIAEKNLLPVVIHSREATNDTIEILKKYKVKGVIHSFSGSYETANEYIKMGFVLGINGVITFKNSNLKDVIKKIPLEYIILETDSPYLTPEPYRGKQNEPKNIALIAEFIADLKEISLEELAKKTNENVSRIFDI